MDVREGIKRRSVFSVGAALLTLVLSSEAESALLFDQAPRAFAFRLEDPSSPTLPLLQPYLDASVEQPGPLRRYSTSRFGIWRRDPWWQLAWGPNAAVASDESGGVAADKPSLEPHPAEASFVDFDSTGLTLGPPEATSWLDRLDPDLMPSKLLSTGPSFVSDGFASLWQPATKPVRSQPSCHRTPVTIARFDSEYDVFSLVGCDGAVAPFAMDRLSILARPADAPSPGALLPDEPDATSWPLGEWVPSVRILNARVLWVLQRIAEEFPHQTITLFSGYRPKRTNKVSGHHSLHAEGRAVDITVKGVSNADLFALCHTLADVGCGFYPNSKFVHVDVRKSGGLPHPHWIDISAPGERARYVDSWPGIIERQSSAMVAPTDAAVGTAP